MISVTRSDGACHNALTIVSAQGGGEMHKHAGGRMLGLLQRAGALPSLPRNKPRGGPCDQGPLTATAPSRSLVKRLAGAWLQKRLARHLDQRRSYED